MLISIMESQGDVQKRDIKILFNFGEHRVIDA